jgi:O-antigen/teichoic acid export membrane protein
MPPSLPEPQLTELQPERPEQPASGLSGRLARERGQRREDRYFGTDHLQRDLRGHAVRGGAATAGAQAAQLLIKFASVPILARLLTPEDFGLIAMVTAVVGFVSMFKEAGLSMATVQRAEINHGQVSTLFWINAVLGALLMLTTACLAPGVAWFYREPRLVGVTLVLSMGIFLGGLTIQHQALLRRQMRFGTLGLVTVVANLIGVATAITLAALAVGYWALVLAPVMNAMVSAVLMWKATGWRPGAPRRGTGVRPMLLFGSNLTGTNFLTYACRNLDNVLLGSVWGAGALAIYSKAYSLLMLPIHRVAGPIHAVAVPTLSRLQEEPERFRNHFCKGVELLATARMPVAAFAFVGVENIILTMLGSQWTESIPVFRALSPSAFVGSIAFGSSWLFLSLGRTDRQFRANLCISIAILASFFIGLRWGPLGVATAYTITYCIARLPLLVYSMYGSPVRWQDVASALWRPAVASAVGAALVVGSRSCVGGPTVPVVGLLVEGGIFLVGFLLTLLALPGGRRRMKGILNLARRVRALQPRPHWTEPTRYRDAVA